MTTSHTPQLVALLQEAARLGLDIMDGLLRLTRDELQRQIQGTRDLLERDVRTRMLSALTQVAPELRTRYPQLLHACFERETSDDPVTTSFDTGPVSIKFEQLELMDDQQVQSRISAGRALQQALNEAELELAELNTLVSTLMGFDQVRPERNPLRPEVFLQALQDLVDASAGDSSLRSGWAQVMLPLLGKTLRPVYQDLLGYLRQQKVQPVRYVISKAPVGAPGVSGAAAGGTAGGPALASGRAPSIGAGVGGSAPTPAHARAAAPAYAAGLTVQQLRGLIAGAAQPDSAALVQQVVGLIIEQITGDERLLPPVRQLIQSLAPQLLSLAQGDPHFFSDKNHPARLLLEEVAQRSLAFESVQASGFADFLAQLRQSLTALHVAADFEAVLGKLRRSWAQEDRLQQARQQAALQALQQAGRRNALAGELAAQIRALPEVALVPDVVVDFACGPWAQVMAQAQLEGDAVLNALKPEVLLEELFWSVRPDQNRQQSARLVKLIPQLLKGLRQGLEQIKYPSEQLQQFLDQLLVLHQGGMDGAITAGARAARPSQPAAGPWLAPEEARDSGFMDDLEPPPVESHEHNFRSTEPMTLPDFPATEPMTLEDLQAIQAQAPAGEPAVPVAGAPVALQPGDWVQLHSEGEWVRLHLLWINDPGTLYLFSGPSGSNHSMTRRMFDRLLGEGRLRLISQGGVVERAFDAVAELAMRNSVFMDLPPS